MIGVDDHVSGRWLSVNESVISVDKMSGRAKAVGIGSTQGADFFLLKKENLYVIHKFS